MLMKQRRRQQQVRPEQRKAPPPEVKSFWNKPAQEPPKPPVLTPAE